VSADQVQRRKAERLDVLRQLYVHGEADPGKTVRFKEQITGYDPDTLASHVLYLTSKGLANQHGQGFLAITQAGVDEYEEVVSKPEEPTEHFPSLIYAQNYVNVRGDVSGQVQVGTVASEQTMGMSVEDLRVLLAEVRAVLDGLALEAAEDAELRSDLRTVDAQLDSPNPKKGIVRESLSSARAVLMGVATREAAAGAERLPHVINILAHAITQLA
jgi:hypothetical protein